MVQGIDATFSLLQKQQQDRADELARRQRDQDLSDTILSGLLKGGLAIGNAVLANKTQDFLNTTEQRAATQIAAQADNNIARFKQEWNAIDADETTGSPLEYLTKQALPFMEAELKANTPDYMEGLDEVRFQAQVRKAAEKVAQQRLDILMEARDIYENKDMNEFESRLDMTRSRYRATDLGELVTQMAAGLFDGKSAQDVDMQEMLDYKDFIDTQDPKSRAYHAKRLKELITAYERSGDMAKAQVTATNKMIADMEIDPSRGPIITEEITTPVKLGNTVILQRQTKTTDSSRLTLDGKPTVTLGEPEFSLMSDDDLTGGGSLISDADLLSATRQAFDIQQFFQNHITREGQDRIIAVMEANVDENGNADPLSFGDLTTTEKYKKVVDTVFEVIRGNITDKTGARVSPNLLKDDEATKIKAALIQRLVDIDIWSEFGTVFSMDPEEDLDGDGIADRTVVLKKAMNNIADIIFESERVTNTLPALDRGQP